MFILLITQHNNWMTWMVSRRNLVPGYGAWIPRELIGRVLHPVKFTNNIYSVIHGAYDVRHIAYDVRHGTYDVRQGASYDVSLPLLHVFTTINKY